MSKEATMPAANTLKQARKVGGKVSAAFGLLKKAIPRAAGIFEGMKRKAFRFASGRELHSAT